MYCIQCGFLRTKNAKFCADCGTQFDEVVNQPLEQEIAEVNQEPNNLDNLHTSSSEREILSGKNDYSDEEDTPHESLSELILGVENIDLDTDIAKSYDLSLEREKEELDLMEVDEEDSVVEYNIIEEGVSEYFVSEENKTFIQNEYDAGNSENREKLSIDLDAGGNKSVNVGSKNGRKLLILTPILLVSAIITILILSSNFVQPGIIPLLDEYRDTDGDGISDANDLCPSGLEYWVSTDITDYDGDGCSDDTEDQDDDQDGVTDSIDNCAKGKLSWDSTSNSDFDSDGCKDANEDYDDDNDGVADNLDDCQYSPTNRVDSDADGCKDFEDDDDDNDGILDTFDDCRIGLQNGLDTDSDGCKDSEDSDDDNDGILDTFDDCRIGLQYGLDTDSDGCKNSEDSDDDNDGYWDWNDDFPLDYSEWLDFDGDGIGDNEDIDDDNDGVLDYYDINDYGDIGLYLTYDSFKVLVDMDYWDSLTETYICLYLEGENFGCEPNEGGDYWSMSTNTLYSLDAEFYLDLPEDVSSHHIQICAFDKDAFEDDRIDINPNSSNNCYNTYIDSTFSIGDSWEKFATGYGDNTGWDGELTFSYELIDFRNQVMNTYTWSYQGSYFSLELNLDYDTYSYYKNLDHTTTSWSDYARFSTPDAAYVIELAYELENMAWNYGFTSSLEEAEFILAFVRGIPYQYDIDGMGVNEYPKYPIEMLWEGAGDCEDAAALYISLMEALEYDAILILLEVKQDSDDDTWGGHAMPGIHIPNHSGTYYYWTSGSKANIPYYLAEATGGDDSIGEDSWYDRQNAEIYDVE